jgi:hypothetical protein
MAISGPEQPSIEELAAMTLEERTRLLRGRSIPLDQLPPETQDRIRVRGQELLAEREPKTAR